MAITELVRLRLEDKGFATLFTDHHVEWELLAESARVLMAQEVEVGPTIDDIKKALVPLVEINPHLREFLAEKKLTQKYWPSDFTDYILHKTYQPKLTIKAAQVQGGHHGGEAGH